MDSLKGRDLLSLADLSIDELNYLLDLAASLKSGMVKLKRCLLYTSDAADE